MAQPAATEQSATSPQPLTEGLWPPLAIVARFAARRPLAYDVAVMLAVNVVTSIPLLVGDENRAWVWLLDQALVLPLVLRRRHPSGVFAFMCAVAFLQWVLNVPLAAAFALPLALFTIAAQQSRTRALVAAAVLEVGVVLASVRFAPARDGLIGSLVLLSGLVLAGLFGGIALSTHRAYLESMVDRTRRLELERDQQAQIAATAERTRIAREMHDIVAHNISVIIALADGAALSNDQGTSQSTEAMCKVSETGRQALAEMRRLLGVLRDDATHTDLAPQPGIARLDDLVDAVRATGLPVNMVVSGTRRPMPASAEATVYRIVQEGLTNTMKHAADPSQVMLNLDWATDVLRIEITDDGRGGIGQPLDGHGLTGMAERTAMFGGSVSAGPVPGGGWRVSARLPVGDRAR
jgi:signal transduction histidine kinase